MLCLSKTKTSVSMLSKPSSCVSSVYLLDGHILSISFARLDFLAGLLDGLEDSLVWKGFGGLDFSGLLLEGDIEGLNTCSTRPC
jgi:hypothetical protein